VTRQKPAPSRDDRSSGRSYHRGRRETRCRRSPGRVGQGWFAPGDRAPNGCRLGRRLRAFAWGAFRSRRQSRRRSHVSQRGWRDLLLWWAWFGFGVVEKKPAESSKRNRTQLRLTATGKEGPQRYERRRCRDEGDKRISNEKVGLSSDGLQRRDSATDREKGWLCREDTDVQAARVWRARGVLRLSRTGHTG